MRRIEEERCGRIVDRARQIIRFLVTLSTDESVRYDPTTRIFITPSSNFLLFDSVKPLWQDERSPADNDIEEAIASAKPMIIDEMKEFEGRLKLDLHRRFLVMEEQARRNYIDQMSDNEERLARLERELLAAEDESDDTEHALSG